MGGGNDNFVYLSANYKETDGHEGYVMFEQQGVNETILSDMEEQNLVSSVMSISNTSEGNESEKGKEKDEFNKDWEDRSESPYSLSEPELEKSYLFVKTQLKGKGTEHKEFDYSFPNDNFPEEDIPSELLQSTHKGLTNSIGEHNCFLNGVLQILWHNKTFRKCLMSVQSHDCQDKQFKTVAGVCVFCKLKSLFLEIQFSDSDRIPPNTLRNTLALIHKPESRFQLNTMADAAECLEAILQRLHNDLVTPQSLKNQVLPQYKDSNDPLENYFSQTRRREATTCNPPCVAHNVFGMSIVEQSVCGCGSTTEPLSYSSFLQYFSVNELKEMALAMTKPLPPGWEKRTTVMGQTYFLNHLTKETCWKGPPGTEIGESPDYSFSFLLHTVAINNLVKCPNDNCPRKNPTFRTLLNIPKVVSIGLSWDSDQSTSSEVHDVMKMIEPFLDLRHMFNATAVDLDDSHLMFLKGMVCYYGKHYVAFHHSNTLDKWLVFDDATIKEVGKSFDEVIEKCIKGNYQPSLLFYESII